MPKYILRADTSKGIVYFRNLIMTTTQKESAQVFKTKKETNWYIGVFEYLTKAKEITIEKI